ncbi:response regulator transcription factor [Hydrogenophaga palleronii]|uniref:response regulator transcription factor n=1 Tax=Hydrogenophaga palleronii TaxID=65655 RepID=UPI000824D57B|nr:response regulator transcription factor [Hydrogenophaga palleronii]
MTAAYTVALVGFSQAESATFESFFRLAARRPPGYQVQDEVMDAQILMVNADNVQAVMLVRDAELPGRVMLVGSSDAGTGWPLQRKPVRLVSMLAALDKLVGAHSGGRDAAAPPPAAPVEAFQVSQLHGLDASMRLASGRMGVVQHAPVLPRGHGADRSFAHTQPFDARALPALQPKPGAGQPPASADSEFPPTRPMIRSDPVHLSPPTPPTPPPATPRKALAAAAPAVRQRPGVMRMTDFGALEDLPLPAPAAPRERRAGKPTTQPGNKTEAPEVARGDMLLVAESLIEGRILLKRFRKYGLTVDWSREAAQSLVMLKAHAYRVVVIDRLKGDPDANQVCRVAKQTKGPKGAPVVIMFAPSAGSMDRMKAGLAGSDAYLSRSVGEAELYKVLAQHRLVSLNGFAPTNVGF